MYILNACEQPLLHTAIATYLKQRYPDWSVIAHSEDSFDYDIMITDQMYERNSERSILVSGEPLRTLAKILEKYALSASRNNRNKAGMLSAREKDVLGLLNNGYSNKEIASVLGIQMATVKLHMRSLCKKLGAKNRTQAALIAQRQGIVD